MQHNGMVKISPKKLTGPWLTGHALDVHSTGSEFLGYDEYGHEQFDTKRTEAGELLYRWKYRGDEAALHDLVEAVAEFVKENRIGVDLVVAVPPTRIRRVQPLFGICEGVAEKLKLPVALNAVRKTGGAELKNLHSYQDRAAALAGAIKVDSSQVAGKRVLVLDDLVRSGATMIAVSEQLTIAGAMAVHVIAITQTRRT